jgi:hypothetical protein
MPISLTAKDEKFKEFNDIMKLRGWHGRETEYVNSDKIMRFICDKGHQSGLRFRVLVKPTGSGCPACRKTNKLTTEDICAIAADRGWVLLPEPIVNTKTKASFLCDKGHTIEMVPERMKKGVRCYECVKEIAKNAPKKLNKESGGMIRDFNRVNINEVIERLKLKGYFLISYSGSLDRNSVVACQDGHKREVKIKILVKEKGSCPECLRLSDSILFNELCANLHFTVTVRYWA